MAISLLIALWVLPGLVAAVTPIPYKDVLGPTRDALITAFIAGDLFIVLPILIESCRTLLARHHVTDERLPDVIVPASFNFPHTGKLLSLSFILFAGWFSGSPIPVTDYPRLAITGLLTFFGSLNSAVPFLLDLFRIPADTFQLFVATSVINSRFGTLTAAVHTVALALIGSAAIAGSLRLESKRLIRYGLTTLALTVATIGGLQVAFHTLLYHEFKGADVVYGMTNLLNNDPSTIVRAGPAAATTQPVLDEVRARGVLRVGFVARRMPFAFRNGHGELVGFDVELAHLLARDIGVKVEFIEFPAGELAGAVSSGAADIGIGGMPLTPRLAMDTLYSEPYLDETLAFVVKDHLRGRFEHWESIAKIRDITIGLPPLPYYETQLRARLPEVPLKNFSPNEDPLSDRAGFEAVALPAERGSVLTMLNPKWTVVVPQPGVVKIPLAFPLARHDRPWATVINTWVEMKKRDGTFEALYDHWILGKATQKDKPRWSVIRDVLHWVK
jgi:ABC-type amino acid transport substrate-binding protein